MAYSASLTAAHTGPLYEFGVAAANTASPLPAGTNTYSSAGYTVIEYEKEGGGASFEATPGHHSTRPAGFKAPYKRTHITEEVILRIETLDLDLEALEFAIASSNYTVGATPGTNPDELDIGQTADVEYAVFAAYLNNAGKKIVIHIPYATPIGVISTGFNEEGDTVHLYEFAGNQHATADNICTIYRETTA